LNPRTRVPKASTLSSRPPKPLHKQSVNKFRNIFSVKTHSKHCAVPYMGQCD
jgi:hypothetical protein